MVSLMAAHLGPELADRDQHHGTGIERQDDLVQLLQVLVALGRAVVGAEEDDTDVPSGALALREHVVAELDPPADLGFDLDLPSEGHQGLAGVVRVALGGGCQDRVADQQHTVAVGVQGGGGRGRHGGRSRGGGGDPESGVEVGLAVATGAGSTPTPSTSGGTEAVDPSSGPAAAAAHAVTSMAQSAPTTSRRIRMNPYWSQ